MCVPALRACLRARARARVCVCVPSSVHMFAFRRSFVAAGIRWRQGLVRFCDPLGLPKFAGVGAWCDIVILRGRLVRFCDPLGPPKFAGVGAWLGFVTLLRLAVTVCDHRAEGFVLFFMHDFQICVTARARSHSAGIRWRRALCDFVALWDRQNLLALGPGRVL